MEHTTETALLRLLALYIILIRKIKRSKAFQGCVCYQIIRELGLGEGFLMLLQKNMRMRDLM